MGEDEWAANPWQAQVDAHIMQLRQAGAVWPQVPGNNPAGPRVAFGMPMATCGVSLEDLLQRNAHLEGQSAYLEERLAMREKELEQAMQQHIGGSSSSSSVPRRDHEAQTLVAEAAELK